LTAKARFLHLRLNDFFLEALNLSSQTEALDVGRSQIEDAEYTYILNTTVVEGRQNTRTTLGNISGIRAHYESIVDSDNLGTLASSLGTGSRTGFFRYTFVIARNIKRRTRSFSFRYNIFRKMVFELQT
jgi:hypothetical protein